MASEWEVDAYVLDDETDAYGYVRVYEGRSRRAALRAARKAHADGAVCIRLEWRPM